MRLLEADIADEVLRRQLLTGESPTEQATKLRTMIPPMAAAGLPIVEEIAMLGYLHRLLGGTPEGWQECLDAMQVVVNQLRDVTC